MFQQEGRLCTITTKLGPDALLVRRVSGREGLSCPFHFMLELLGTSGAVDPAAVLGQSATLTLALAGGGKRHLNGIITRFAQASADRRLTVYQAEMMPWFWLLTRRTDCRIFQNETVPDIVKKVFAELKFNDYELRLSGTYDPRVYCVQYRESDFDFVSRLLEEEGIFYFFEHTDKTHTLVMADTPSHHVPCPGQPSATYDPGPDRHEAGDAIQNWLVEHQLQPGAYALTDFNFLDPAANLLVSGASAVTAGADSRLEVYDYPGDFVLLGAEEDAKLEKGEARLKLRRQEGDCRALTVRGESDCRAFQPGFRFDLLGHYRSDFNDTSYVLTEVRHDLTQEATYESAGQGISGWTSRYENSFVCIPHAVPYRPPRATPKPRVPGPQTALVVGPKGEEIHVDKHGRVMVQFPWDRLSQADETSSCWIRVAQVWAGKQWGGMFIPRIGQEVVVDFLEGDPDRPLITGRVYNGAAVPPYELPANATVSTIKSYSSKGGGGFNEIRFEDKKDSEEIFINAQRQLDTRVGADCHEFVGNDRHLIVKKDQIEHVQNNRQEKVDADHYEEIGKDRHLKVAGKEAIEIGGSRSLTVKGNVSEALKAGFFQEVAQGAHLKAMEVVIEAMQGLTIKCGGNAVVIDPSGVTLKGSMVTIDGGTTKINSGPGSPAAAVKAIAAVAPAAPAAAVEAGTAVAGAMTTVKPHKPPQTPEEKERKTSWIEIELVDEDDNPVPGARYAVELPDGTTAAGTLDEKGFARVEGFDPGGCKVTFPDLDQDAWEKA